MKTSESSGIVELQEDVAGSPFYNHDLAPVGKSGRRWSTKDMAVLWISMAACIPTYTLASSMIEQGMDWKQAIFTILLGNIIVLIPMVLNAHAGTKYGIPFPFTVAARSGSSVPIFPPCCELSWHAVGSAFKRGSADKPSIRFSNDSFLP